MNIICPGTFPYQDTVCPTTMIPAGNFGLLLIHCYGFGGHIYTEESPSRWMQNMNQSVKEIPHPQQSVEQEKRLMNLVLKQGPFKDAIVYTASVFTRPNVILSAPADSHIYDRADMNWESFWNFGCCGLSKPLLLIIKIGVYQSVINAD